MTTGAQTRRPTGLVARRTRHRGTRVAILVTAFFAMAGISTSTQARTAADPGRSVAGQQFTGLAARVLSRPSAVRATDGRFHIVYELVLTNMTQVRGGCKASRRSRWQNPSSVAIAVRAGPVLEDESGRHTPGSQAGPCEAARLLRFGGRLVRRSRAKQGGRPRRARASRGERDPPLSAPEIDPVFQLGRSRLASIAGSVGARSAPARRAVGGR